MYQIRNLDIPSVAIYSFILYLVLTFIVVLPIGLIMSVVSSFAPATEELDSGIFSVLSGVFIILLPIFYAVIGTIINVIIAFIYNLISKKFGGLKIELHRVDQMNQTIE